MLLTGLDPVVGAMPTVLVLGSMPGVRSLEWNEYYAHAQNRFWRLVEDVVGIPRAQPYDARTAAVERAGLALWDVLKHCTREGSLDRDIAPPSEVPNDVVAFLETHASIRTVALNGRKAADAFRRHIEPDLTPQLKDRVRRMALPSTSAANTRTGYPALLEAWGPPLRSLARG